MPETDTEQRRNSTLRTGLETDEEYFERVHREREDARREAERMGRILSEGVAVTDMGKRTEEEVAAVSDGHKDKGHPYENTPLPKPAPAYGLEGYWEDPEVQARLRRTPHLGINGPDGTDDN